MSSERRGYVVKLGRPPSIGGKTRIRCSYGTCKTRYYGLRVEENSSTFFIPFAKPCMKFRKNLPHPDYCAECNRAEKWIRACWRADGQLSKLEHIKKHHKVCSLHFVGGNGPTEKYPDPVPLYSDKLPKASRKSPKVRLPLPPKVKKPINPRQPLSNVEGVEVENDVTEFQQIYSQQYSIGDEAALESEEQNLTESMLPIITNVRSISVEFVQQPKNVAECVREKTLMEAELQPMHLVENESKMPQISVKHPIFEMACNILVQSTFSVAWHENYCSMKVTEGCYVTKELRILINGEYEVYSYGRLLPSTRAIYTQLKSVPVSFSSAGEFIQLMERWKTCCGINEKDLIAANSNSNRRSKSIYFEPLKALIAVDCDLLTDKNDICSLCTTERKLLRRIVKNKLKSQNGKRKQFNKMTFIEVVKLLKATKKANSCLRRKIDVLKQRIRNSIEDVSPTPGDMEMIIAFED